MRIVSGKHKGRRFTAPKNLPTRPTTDMAKEALFNILNNNYFFSEISVIDLFAGIGSISIEFASRGTENIIAIDNHLQCVRFIKSLSNEFDANINTIKSDVFKFLEKTTLTADIIFADPPYNFSEDQFLTIINAVIDKAMLKTDGVLIIEHSKHTNLANHTNYSYQKSYGGNVFSFFEAKDVKK